MPLAFLKLEFLSDEMYLCCVYVSEDYDDV